MRTSFVFLVAVLLAASVWAQTAPEYNAAGVEHYNAKRWEEAVMAFEAAYQLSPDHPTVRRNLSNTYQAVADELARRHDLATAIDYLNLAVSVDPESAMPLVQLGLYYLRDGRINEAIFRLEEAVELAPDSADAHALLGDAYYDDNDIPSALAEWEWVATKEPNRPGLKEKISKALRENAVEQDFGRYATRHFTLSYGRETNGAAVRNVLHILERAYRDVGQQLGRSYPPTPIQVIIYTSEGFSEATQLSEHIGALYDGKIRVPLTNGNGQPVDDEELSRRLYHEYVHVVVRHLTGDKIPWWLNEGLAEMLSKEMSDQDMVELQKGMQEGRLYALKDLEPSQLESRSADELRLAYYQAHTVVSYLWSRYGQKKMLDLCAAIRAGEAPEDALSRLYHRTYETLQGEVEVQITRGRIS
jgi:hypothetical protein